MKNVKIKDPKDETLIIGVVPIPCLRCEYPEVVGMMLEDRVEFVAWCPCGTIYTDERSLQSSLEGVEKDWWK